MNILETLDIRNHYCVMCGMDDRLEPNGTLYNDGLLQWRLYRKKWLFCSEGCEAEYTGLAAQLNAEGQI